MISKDEQMAPGFQKRYIAWMPKPGPYRQKEGENV